MDKLLKPKDLDVLPTDSNAASVFKYWIATFESFLQAVETGQAVIDPSVEDFFLTFSHLLRTNL